MDDMAKIKILNITYKEATDKIHGVVLETSVGGKRILHKPMGDPVPRIC